MESYCVRANVIDQLDLDPPIDSHGIDGAVKRPASTAHQSNCRTSTTRSNELLRFLFTNQKVLSLGSPIDSFSAWNEPASLLEADLLPRSRD